MTDGKLVLELEVAEEGSYTVTTPFIQGFVTEADTLEKAFEMAELAAVRASLRQPTTGA